jgi:hypothetical protein
MKSAKMWMVGSMVLAAIFAGCRDGNSDSTNNHDSIGNYDSIGEDRVVASDSQARKMLIAQAKSYYSMFNMADNNPAMRPSTLNNPMLAMWGGSAEAMLKDMIEKCGEYDCPESKKRYEYCLKLCLKWRS